MKWNINKSRPICPQLCEQICVGIKNKELLPQEKIYSVRELAIKLGVNPNTVSKAYTKLEELGYIKAIPKRVGSNTFVMYNIKKN